MKTVERYVFGSFLSSFVLAFLVLSFVLTIGLLVQIVGYILDGVPMRLVGEFCLVSVPETLQLSVPLALLVSSVLVFSRLSADSEIAAMRACGIHLVSVMKWPLAFGLLCTLLGFWINNEIVPHGHRFRRTLKERVSVGAGLAVLEPGRWIDDFPNVKIYFGSKEGNWLHDLVAYDYTMPGVTRTITAEKALVTQQGADVTLEFYRMTVDPLDADRPTMARFDRFAYTIPDVLHEATYDPGTKDMGFLDLRREIARLRSETAKAPTNETLRTDLSSALVELNKRFVFAMAAVCFVLVGIPLGIRSQRKENSVGMVLSLVVALVGYAFILLAISLEEHGCLHPELLVWLPIAAYAALAVKLMRRHL